MTNVDLVKLVIGIWSLVIQSTMLPRTLEPELMDTAEDAHEYDAMDHSAVNALFVTDLLASMTDWSLRRSVNTLHNHRKLLDLGAGTAQIPIELARRAPDVRITAIDAAQNMLVVARENIARGFPLPCREGPGEGSSKTLPNRIELLLADAKHLPFNDRAFPVVISNSIVHHIPDPRAVLSEAIRVTAPGGLLFHRDLARPRDEAELNHLVETYAANATAYQRKLFADSLRAALSVDEIRKLISNFGFAPDTVQMTSDRHWTWIATTR
jgi:ubiquinone/menaquinone biosynthesis C-methylase UbiE